MRLLREIINPLTCHQRGAFADFCKNNFKKTTCEKSKSIRGFRGLHDLHE